MREESERTMNDYSKNENNMVSLVGEITCEFEFSNETYGEHFYMTYMNVPRLSSCNDVIPLLISERLIERDTYRGLYARIKGQFRSLTRDGKLILFVFVTEIEVEDTLIVSPQSNQVLLKGYVCRKPVYRTTPNGREISDFMIAVNRSYGKSDYIPCICWGRNAKYVEGFNVGKQLVVNGRIQSREYIKKLNEEYAEKRIAYEVSITKLEEI